MKRLILAVNIVVALGLIGWAAFQGASSTPEVPIS